MRRCAELAAVAMAVCVPTASCANTDDEHRGVPLTPNPPASLLVAANDPSAAESVVEGKVEIDRERECVFVDGLPAVWPKGTRWRGLGDDTVIALPDRSLVRDGDSVTGSGTVADPSVLRSLELRPGDNAAGLECASDAGSVVVLSEIHVVRG
jgi:hypothetical protein